MDSLSRIITLALDFVTLRKRAMFFLILYTTERVQSIKCTFLLIIFVVLQMVNITPERRRFS